MHAMNNKDFVARLAQKLELDNESVFQMVDSFVISIADQICGGKIVSIQGFGNFELKEKAERKIYNPSSKSIKIVPSKKVVNYRMSQTLKEKINTP